MVHRIWPTPTLEQKTSKHRFGYIFRLQSSGLSVPSQPNLLHEGRWCHFLHGCGDCHHLTSAAALQHGSPCVLGSCSISFWRKSFEKDWGNQPFGPTPRSKRHSKVSLRFISPRKLICRHHQSGPQNELSGLFFGKALASSTPSIFLVCKICLSFSGNYNV